MYRDPAVTDSVTVVMAVTVLTIVTIVAAVTVVWKMANGRLLFCTLRVCVHCVYMCVLCVCLCACVRARVCVCLCVSVYCVHVCYA